MTAPLVIHVATADQGLRFLLLNQMRAIAAAGYRVHGISSDGPHLAAVRAAGVPVSVVPMARAIAPGRDIAAIKELVGLFRTLRPAIVHTHNPKPGLIGQIAARLARVPIIVNTIHGLYFHPGSTRKAKLLYSTTERIAALCSDAILSQNSEDIATMVRLRICSREAISYLGNGIDITRFDRRAIDPGRHEALRAELGLGAGPVIGAVGRLVAEKGYRELFAALASLAPRYPSLKALIIGPHEPDKADAIDTALAAQYGIADRVVFTGVRHDMPELYSLMDIMAHASYREGFPRAPMEASAMGVPVVATDIRGCREAVFHGGNGLLVPVRDSGALAAALGRLLENPAQRQSLGQQARSIAEQRFDERRVFATVIATYERLLAEKGGAYGA